jgi:hypothetical protein
MTPVEYSAPGNVPTVTHDPFAKLAHACIAVATLMVLAGPTASAQTVKPAKPAQTSIAADVSFQGPQWNELNPAQQKILAPLATKWNDLPAERKSKWMALAQRYPTLPPADQEKLQSRMSEWASLKPRDRERARLNYAETKKLAPHERNADWEAYQALSPEEKRRLAAKAATRPTGAAVAVTPVAANQLTPVPLTRRNTERNAAPVTAKPILDRNTLLPLAPRANPDWIAPGN